jgi:hypothetical protein
VAVLFHTLSAAEYWSQAAKRHAELPPQNTCMSSFLIVGIKN